MARPTAKNDSTLATKGELHQRATEARRTLKTTNRELLRLADPRRQWSRREAQGNAIKPRELIRKLIAAAFTLGKAEADLQSGNHHSTLPSDPHQIQLEQLPEPPKGRGYRRRQYDNEDQRQLTYCIRHIDIQMRQINLLADQLGDKLRPDDPTIGRMMDRFFQLCAIGEILQARTKNLPTPSWPYIERVMASGSASGKPPASPLELLLDELKPLPRPEIIQANDSPPRRSSPPQPLKPSQAPDGGLDTSVYQKGAASARIPRSSDFGELE